MAGSRCRSAKPRSGFLSGLHAAALSLAVNYNTTINIIVISGRTIIIIVLIDKRQFFFFQSHSHPLLAQVDQQLSAGVDAGPVLIVQWTIMKDHPVIEWAHMGSIGLKIITTLVRWRRWWCWSVNGRFYIYGAHTTRQLLWLRPVTLYILPWVLIKYHLLIKFWSLLVCSFLHASFLWQLNPPFQR